VLVVEVETRKTKRRKGLYFRRRVKSNLNPCACLKGYVLCSLDFVGQGIEACKCEVELCQFFFLPEIFIFPPSQPGPIPLTIENVLFNALVKVGAVSQDNADNPTKVRNGHQNIQALVVLIIKGCYLQVRLARAARTDAGVHAAGNVVSLKLINIIPGVDDLIASINEQLPPAIRVWGYVSTFGIHLFFIESALLTSLSGQSTKIFQCPIVSDNTPNVTEHPD
jgi:hypothetical protein